MSPTVPYIYVYMGVWEGRVWTADKATLLFSLIALWTTDKNKKQAIVLVFVSSINKQFC